MANTDTETPGLSDLTRREDNGTVVLEEVRVDATSTTVVPEKAPEAAFDVFENEPSVSPMELGKTRPTIITTAVASGSTSSTGLSAPHPKRFNAVNINKKFLQKNSSSPISLSPTSANSSSHKSGVPAHPIPRPTAQLSGSHSRLVTTKLTATPQPSTTTGPGWSRPSSVNTSVSPSPPTSNANGPSVNLAPAAPHLPHAGKVIQPQHRTTTNSAGGSLKKDGSGKPVWGNTRSGVSPSDSRVQDDFPTAAEVANVTISVRRAKLTDAKEVAENAAADKQARSVEADTFRGVHLDPNAHHWDEMEEDDDNFLDGVIEFGDGRQYKIQPADISAQSTGPPGSTLLDARASPQPTEAPIAPVSKEERFADDYDRSWPRSKTSPAIPQREPPPHSQYPTPSSPSSSQATYSPQDASRVLFNERSNKLEPYSSAHPHRPGPGPSSHSAHKKGSLADAGVLSTDPRGGRDVPPHTQATNVQLLQKSGVSTGDAPTRPGPFGPIPVGSTIFSKDRVRDRDTRRQVVIPAGQDSSRGKDHFEPPSLSPGSKDLGREITNEPRGRRLSNMGPPAISLSMRDRSKETGRQLPPHLSQISAPPPPSQRRLPSREPQPRPPSTVPSDSASSGRHSFAHPPSHSPVLSHRSITSETASQALSVPQVDLEQVHKAAMHLSAERAKQRRQQEEEKRAKEGERARQKAAALEERLKASASANLPAKPADEAKPSDTEVTTFLEDAIKSSSPLSAHPPPSSVKPLQRPPSLRATVRQPSEVPRPMQSVRSPQSAGVVPSPALETESWRSKAKVLPPTPHRQIHVGPSIVTPIATPKPPPPMLHGVEPLAVQPDEDLEVVDFSDMGKFVGVADPKEERSTADDRALRPARPVASDFFGEHSSARDSVASKSDTGPWRRRPSHDFDHSSSTSGPAPRGGSEIVTLPLDIEKVTDTNFTQPPALPEITLDPSTKEKPVSHDPQSVAGSGRPVLTPPVINGQRALRSTLAFREAAMSTIDDTMSRIKGALDDMQQTADNSKDTGYGISENVQPVALRARAPPMPTDTRLPRDKWVPPALRSRNHGFDQQPREVFDITMPEPPRSPRPAWNTFVVRLPMASQLLEPLTKRQSHLHKSPPGHVRWDILSFDPPVEGMNRRDFSINDVLFRNTFKGKRRYIVSIPKPRPLPRDVSGSDSTTGHKIRVPPSPVTLKVNGMGTFGRLSGGTDVTTWRKSAAPSVKTATVIADSGLNTVSRSPPPDLVSNSCNTASTEVDESASARPRSQPKMPAGSAVAFYRDARVDSLESAPKSSVNFTVTSELEEASQSNTKAESSKCKLQPTASPSVKVAIALPSAGLHATPVVGELKSQPASPELVQSNSGSKSSEDSAGRAPITPPSQSASAMWTKPPLNFPVKDSPARAPDPEHLKAVWSQASDKARVHSVNSLEAIADDLTGLPFTLQDVKSEDGETPPPTSSAAPSRMSLHEVTRAFQQVPSSSSSTASQRSAPLSPSSASGPVAKPPSFQYSLPPQNPNLQPSYVAYPSPMMSHSPGPTLVYPSTSPVPSRIPVNGHSPMFSQPLWMPLAAPPNQTHGMMRAAPPPYPGQMMHYPLPSGGPSMYGHIQPNMQNPTSPSTGGSQARGRGLPMSPAMQHAASTHAPMYPTSPGLIHAPGMQGHAYISPVLASRGQLRTDPPGHSPMQHTPTGHHPSPHPGYSPVPPASFARTNW